MKLRTLLTLTAATAAAMAAPAYAQEATASGEQVEATGNDVVVTAQRREQRLQDVPIPITALSGAETARLQIDDAFDIAKYVPSTHVTQSAFKGTATYFIRGVGSLDITSTNDPPVTIYENDLIVARPNANNIGLFDVDRIEVLRGPQGTLFGRNTSGGAVNIILKKPADHIGGFAEGTYGSFDKYTLRGSIDLPVSDTVLTKTTGFFLSDPGFVKNITTGETVGGEKNWGIREDVRLLPLPGLTWDLSGEYTRSSGLGFQLRQVGTPAPAVDAPAAPVYYQTSTGSRVGDCGSNPLRQWTIDGTGNCSVGRSLAFGSTMNYDTGGGNVQFLYGFRQYWATYAFDVSNLGTSNKGGSNLFSDGSGTSHSAELKWSSDLFDGRFKYVAGLYYINIKDSNRLSTATSATTALGYTVSKDIRIKTDVNSFAGYLQGDITILDPLTLTLGGRYTHDVKHLDYVPQTEFGGPTISTAQVVALGRPVRQTYDKFTPRVALQYKIDPNVSVYASATNGFKSPSWNANIADPNLVVTVAAEKVWAYELGLRSQFLDRKITLNLTAFQQKLTGYQNTVQVVLPGQATISTLLENIADLRVRGVEFDLNLAPTDRLSFSANGSFDDAKYLKAYPFPGVPAANQLKVTEPVTQVPKFQITAGPNYRLPLPGDSSVTFSGLWRHSSTYQISILNPIRSQTDDFLDAIAQYDSGKFYGSIGCTNCLDRKSYMLILRGNVYPMDPRRVTAKVGFKF